MNVSDFLENLDQSSKYTVAKQNKVSLKQCSSVISIETADAKVDWHIRNFLRLCTLGGEQTANEGTHQLETHGRRACQIRRGLLRIITSTKLMDKMMVAVRGMRQPNGTNSLKPQKQQLQTHPYRVVEFGILCLLDKMKLPGFQPFVKC